MKEFFRTAPIHPGDFMKNQNATSFISSLPAAPGTYTLILKVDRQQQLRAGKLGLLTIQPGYYVYVGSAFGPGGLRGRLSHHLRRSSKPHWHIDYLRRAAKIQEIWFVAGTERYEHPWAEILESRPKVVIPFPGFGASDCKCRSHLFFMTVKPELCSFFGRIGFKNIESLVIEK